jgi:peptidoglycan-N-acetylglucosamine deacetylase
MSLLRKLALLPLLFLCVSCSTTPTQEEKPAPGPKTGSGTVRNTTPTNGYVFTHVPTAEPVVALTFDDGPNPRTTPKLLDTLEQQGVHVTFFVLGQNAKLHPEILQREVAAGNEVGSHSFSHPQFTRLSEAQVVDELQRTDDAIASAIGKRPTLLRPPYGSLTQSQRRFVHDRFGYNIILWAIDPNDWRKPGVDVVVDRIVPNVHNGDIVLIHDIHEESVEAVPAIIRGLKQRGFRFVTVSELIALGGNRASANTSSTRSNTTRSTPTATRITPAATATSAPTPAPAAPSTPAPAPATEAQPPAENNSTSVPASENTPASPTPAAATDSAPATTETTSSSPAN